MGLNEELFNILVLLPSLLLFRGYSKRLLELNLEGINDLYKYEPLLVPLLFKWSL